MFGDRFCCHEWEQGCHWYLRMLTILQCTEQPHNKAQNINSAKVIKTGIQMAKEKFRLSVSSLLKSFLPHGNMQSDYIVPLQKSFWLPYLSAQKMLLRAHLLLYCTYFSTLIYFCPIDPFFWLPQATLFPDSLCLKGCYLPHKQQLSFVNDNSSLFKIQSKLSFP